MKPALITILTLLLFPSLLPAQFYVGPVLGYSRINGKASVNDISLPTSGTPGFEAGMTANCALTSHVSLQSGLLASVDGFAMPGLLFISQGVRAYNLRMPMSVQYNTGKDGCGIFAAGGSYAAYNIYSQASVLYLYTQNMSSKDAQYVPKIRPFGFGLTANAGYQLHNGLFAGIGYRQGLTNLFEADNKVAALFVPYQATAFAGYLIGKSKATKTISH